MDVQLETIAFKMGKSHVLQLALEEPHNDAATAASPSRVQDDESESLVYRRVRRQVLERGLPRHHSQKLANDGHQRARITRLERQIAIVERYHREMARQELRRRDEPADARQSKVTAAGAIVVEQRSHFSRKISLRQLPPKLADPQAMNQLEDSLQVHFNEDHSCSSASDIEQYAIIASQPITSPRLVSAIPGVAQSTNTKNAGVSAPKTHTDKTIAHVLCEFKITKDIMMREHLVEDINEAVAALNQLASELYDMAQRKLLLEGSNGNALPLATLRRPSNSAPTTEQTGAFGKQLPKSGEILGFVPSDPIRRAEELSEWEAKNASLVHSAQKHAKSLHRLCASLQATTISLVHSIVEWRGYKRKPSTISNIDKLHRFGWKKRNISNYLIHLDTDLRDLFPSPAMSVLLGVNAKYNPLLLPRAVLDKLGIAEDTFVSTTFLTDRQDAPSRAVNSPSKREAPSPTKRQAYVALNNALSTIELLSPPELQYTEEQVLRCLEAIRHEHGLECRATEYHTAEKQRITNAYNPFESIKIAGGVDATFASVLSVAVVNDAIERADQLRKRQEDTTRAKEYIDTAKSLQDPCNDRQHPFHVNPTRLRRLIEQRRDVRDVTAGCELQSTTTSWQKNKLGGEVMIRRMNIRRMENQHARKIQRQFLVYRRRTQLLKSLTQFVISSRQHIMSIQRVVRAFIARKRYDEAKRREEEQCRYRQAIKTIWYAYKRYKRRQRHRHSMSVEAVAQIQLLRVIEHNLEDNDASAAERYRKVGEERRRQRAIYLYKRRQEQLEIDAKRAAAAVRLQSFYRMHLARKIAHSLRGERRAHLTAVSAMMIQSKIRKFLKRQEQRRERFRSDMERVNRSAVRIQSIYRGYNFRASFMEELNALAQRNAVLGVSLDEAEDDTSDRCPSEPGGNGDDKSGYVVLPPIVKLTLEEMNEEENSPKVAKVSLPPIRPRMQPVQRHMSTSRYRMVQSPPSARRQESSGMTKVELKLKETTLGDDLESNSTARRNTNAGFLGPFRQRISSTTSSTPRDKPGTPTTSITSISGSSIGLHPSR